MYPLVSSLQHQEKKIKRNNVFRKRQSLKIKFQKFLSIDKIPGKSLIFENR